MLDMIFFEHHSEGYANRQIRKDSESAIGFDSSKREIVRNLMNSQKRVLICSGADDVCRDEEGEGKDGGLGDRAEHKKINRWIGDADE